MYGLMENGWFVVAVIIGEKATGEGPEQGFGYREAGNQEIMAGIGEEVIGEDRNKVL
jgi:hypothetical protein